MTSALSSVLFSTALPPRECAGEEGEEEEGEEEEGLSGSESAGSASAGVGNAAASAAMMLSWSWIGQFPFLEEPRGGGNVSVSFLVHIFYQYLSV